MNASLAHLLPGDEAAPGHDEPHSPAGGTQLPVLYETTLPAILDDEDEALRAIENEDERLARWRLGMQAELVAMQRSALKDAVLSGDDQLALAARYGVPLRMVRDLALRVLTARPEPDHDLDAALARLGWGCGHGHP